MAKKDKDAQNRMIFILTLAASVGFGAIFIGIKAFSNNPGSKYTIQNCIKSNKANNFYPLVETEAADEPDAGPDEATDQRGQQHHH